MLRNFVRRIAQGRANDGVGYWSRVANNALRNVLTLWRFISQQRSQSFDPASLEESGSSWKNLFLFYFCVLFPEDLDKSAMQRYD